MVRVECSFAREDLAGVEKAEIEVSRSPSKRRSRLAFPLPARENPLVRRQIVASIAGSASALTLTI